MSKKKKVTEAPSTKGEFRVIHPTYILIIDWENDELNQKLLLEIMRERTRDPKGNPRSNSMTCWHSQDKILQATGEAGAALGDMFGKAFKEYAEKHSAKGSLKLKLQAWAMMYRDGSYATPHTHPNCHMSGVYYVETPTEVESNDGSRVAPPGTLELLDTRGGPNLLSIPGTSLGASISLVTPKPGRMVIFPAWAPHWVHPVRGDAERVSVACNASILSMNKPETT